MNPHASTVGSLVVALSVLASLGTVAPISAQGYRPPPYRPREVRCESQSRRHTYCDTYARGRVRLERRLSKTPCVQYDTWGADRDGGGVWVRDGCRAVFVVLPWGDGPGYRPGPGPGAGPGPGWSSGYNLTCKSDRFRPQYCPLPRWGRVRLERRLSDAPCRQYDTWGSDGGGIWVDRGCQAIFSVR